MTPDVLTSLRQRLPREMQFNYYADRQSPWLLTHSMPDQAKIAQLRALPVGKLLSRPAMAVLIARSGGLLRRSDLAAIAYADRFDLHDQAGPTGRAALDAVWALTWQDFLLSFAEWGKGGNWANLQLSREGGNLVIQLGFPSDHAELLGRYLDKDVRQKFEEQLHPVRRDGRPTLAWARVDVDFDTGEALIEEVQSDWLRNVADEVDWLASSEPRSRDLRAHQAYKQALFARYAKVWPQAMLLATLVILRDLLGLRRIWMHQPEPGAILKGIRYSLPPRSLYTALPKAFCFAPVREIPALLDQRRMPRLQRQRVKAVKAMARIGRAVFWRLDL